MTVIIRQAVLLVFFYLVQRTNCQWVYNKKYVGGGSSGTNLDDDRFSVQSKPFVFPSSPESGAENFDQELRPKPPKYGNGYGVLSSFLSSFPQFASIALNAIFNRPTHLPANDISPGQINIGATNSNEGSASSPDNVLSPSTTQDPAFDAEESTADGKCSCIESTMCFLPSTAKGECGKGRILCCKSHLTRPVRGSPPEESNNPTIKNDVLRDHIFPTFQKDTDTVVDDVVDLLTHPYLSRQEKRMIATRFLRSRGL